MRHLKILTLSILFLSAFSPKAFANSYCGLEESSTGVELKYYYHMMVGMNFCKGDYVSKYQTYRKQKVTEHGALHQRAEAYLKGKMSSFNCKMDIGDTGGRAEKGAIDSWTTSLGNQYAMQASKDTAGYCQLANKYLDLRMGKKVAELETQREVPHQAARESVQAKEQVQLAVQRVEPSKSSARESYTSASSYRTGGSLYMPTSLAYTNSYQNLLPQGFNPATFGMMPQMIFIPGVGFVPANQPVMNPLMQQSGGVY